MALQKSITVSEGTGNYIKVMDNFDSNGNFVAVAQLYVDHDARVADLNDFIVGWTFTTNVEYTDQGDPRTDLYNYLKTLGMFSDSSDV